MQYLKAMKSKKQKCPKCNSTRTEQGSDFLVCKKCGFLHQKTEKEKNDNNRHSNV